jgi:recombination protein RecR
MSLLPKSVQNLIDELAKLPGIGPKSAGRIVFYLIKNPELTKTLSETIAKIKEQQKYCSLCFNITDRDPCEICADEKRDRKTICVVEQPLDLVAIEKTGKYKGLYHVLRGAISLMDGFKPEDLTIKELLDRIKKGGVTEVILATNPNTEGETTALFIAEKIKKLLPNKIKITRIGRGLSTGADIEYADEITLSEALEGRREI